MDTFPLNTGARAAAAVLAESEFIDRIDKNYQEKYRPSKSEIKNYLRFHKALHAEHPKLCHKKARYDLAGSMLTVISGGYVLLSFYIEFWELCPHFIVEIGMSIYDPRMQRGTLVPITKHIHIVVDNTGDDHAEEYHNGKHVPDRRNKFMGVDSIRMYQLDIRGFIQGIIDYYSEQTDLGIALVGHSLQATLDWLTRNEIELHAAYKIDTHTLFNHQI